MLSEKSRPVIEATLPIIAERIGHITPDFYERMFAARPDLMDGLFSRSLSSKAPTEGACRLHCGLRFLHYGAPRFLP